MRRTISELIVFVLCALLAPDAVWAQAAPVYSPGGPDAEAYGKAAGYPLGTRATTNVQRNMVGAYSHTDTLFPTHKVPRAAAPSPFTRAAQELAVTYQHQGAPRGIADYLDHHPTTGLLIARDRTILFEHYQYGRTDQDTLLSNSMAKTITAMLIGIAVDEGRIRSIDDPAAAYVPDLAGTELGRTPLRALLHMASGIAYKEVYDGQDDAAKLGRMLFQPNGPGPIAAVSQFQDRIAAPDTKWNYAGVNTEVLGLVLTRATGMSMADYLASRIWSRIGAESDAAWRIDPSGQEVGFGSFAATLRDWARLGVLLANDGAWDGQQIIPKQWVLDATMPPPPGHFLAPRTMSRFYGYGYQVWLLPGPRQQFALLGIHGQVILIDPPSKLVMVHTAVRLKPTRDETAAELQELWRAVVAQAG